MNAWLPMVGALFVEAGILAFIAYVSGVLDWEARKVEEHHRRNRPPEADRGHVRPDAPAHAGFRSR